jgi:L-aspartate oxidase
MHSQCGVIRDAKGLSETLDWVRGVEKRNGPARALVAARLILAGALAREESRGGHFRSDFPHAVAPHRTFMRRGEDGQPLILHAPVGERN